MRTKNRLGSVVVLLLAGCGAEAGTGSVGEEPAGEEVVTGTDEQILQVLEKRGIARDQVVSRGDEVIVGGDLHFTRSELLRPQPAAPEGEMIDKGFFCDATVPGCGSGNRTVHPNVVSHIKIIFDSSMNNMAQGWKWAIQDAAYQWSQAHIRGLFAPGTFGTNIYIDANDKFPNSWAQAFITVRADTTTCQPNEFACSPGPSGISGNFAALPGARVTIHSGNVNGFTQAQRTHTAMHELGHTLGYMHQGVGTQIPFTQQFPPSVMQTGQLSIFELREDDELSAVLLYTEAAPTFNEFAPDTAYCSDPNFPCDLGEGDCDNDSQCKGGLVCGTDNGPLYGLPSTYDVCERPARQNNDSVRPVCPTAASTSFCDNPGCPCGLGMGDCDRDSQCGGGLVCGLNNGAAVGLASDWEVCSHRVLPGCATFDVNVPDSAFCTVDCPCTLGGGDCDSDDECRGSLVCGSNNGPSFGLPATWDVCVMP